MKSFWKTEEGQGMVEYALIIASVALVVIVGVTLLGKSTNNLFSSVSDSLKLGS